MMIFVYSSWCSESGSSPEMFALQLLSAARVTSCYQVVSLQNYPQKPRSQIRAPRANATQKRTLVDRRRFTVDFQC